MVGAAEVTKSSMPDELASALAEIESLRAENERLRGLLGLGRDREAEPPVAWEPTLFAPAVLPRPAVDRRSSPDDKIGLFRSLFAGRDDVYAVRWQNDRSGKSGWSPAVVGGWANSKRPDREYEPLTDAVIERHLAGDISVGLYPLLRNDRCRLLACDFDGGTWTLDGLDDGFALIPTMDTPHWTVVLAAATAGQFERVRAHVRGPVDNPTYRSSRR